MPSRSANRPPASIDCQDELLELFEVLTNVIFCMKGPDNCYTAVNSAFVRRTGRPSKRDVVGRRAADLFDAELAARYEEQDAAVFATGTPLRDELELIRRADGRLGWYVTTKFAVTETDADGDRSIVGLVSVSRDLETPNAEGIAIESLTDVVAHVGRNIGETIRVADLAAAAGCSEPQLERRMKKVFGLTPTQYVLRVRVDRATELLEDTDVPLAGVAAECGFYDQADLTRRFARLTGETPASFRTRHR